MLLPKKECTITTWNIFLGIFIFCTSLRIQKGLDKTENYKKIGNRGRWQQNEKNKLNYILE